MKRWLRDHGVPAVMLTIKLLTALRTGLDTYLVSGDIINVLLLDGVFLALWLALAYGGDGQQMKRFRPFAVVGAITMYVAMIVIGLEAHHSLVSLAVRLAGGMALAADVWDWAATAFINWRESRKIRREDVPNVYGYARRGFMKRLHKSVDKSVRKLGGHMDVMVYEQIRTALPAMLDGRFDDVVTVEATPIVSEERQLTSKLTPDARRSQIQRYVDANPDVTVTELSDALGVSRGTIYNDLEKLEIEL